MYESESYVVEADIIDLITTTSRVKDVEITSTILEVEYLACTYDNDDNEGFINVRKRIHNWKGELRNNTVELVVLKGFPLTGRRVEILDIDSGCFFSYFFSLLASIPFIIVQILTPYSSYPILCIFPAVYFTVLPLCCYLVVFSCMRNTTLESYREYHAERDAVVLLGEEAMLEIIQREGLESIERERERPESIEIEREREIMHAKA